MDEADELLVGPGVLLEDLLDLTDEDCRILSGRVEQMVGLICKLLDKAAPAEGR